MGCICSKGVNDERKSKKESKKSSKRLSVSSRKDEVVAEVENGANDATTRLISSEYAEKSSGFAPAMWEEEENKPMTIAKAAETQMQIPVTLEPKSGDEQPRMRRVLSSRNDKDGAQLAAAWPSWLTAVAGEAIKGWIPRRAESFEKLDKIGQGTYSSVYRARDLETGKIVALKKVRFANMDPESVRFMAREIHILRRLDHPNVMKLEGLVTSRVSGNLYLVFEYMEHDLAGLAASPSVRFTEPQIKCYMQQLLRGLEHCHSRGVLHRDIKGSNLLIDNDGNLKIGDFGLATLFQVNQKQPLTSRVVTLWYRPPELLLGATDYGIAVDLWSSGCILAELFAGKPIMPGRTEVEQLHKIFKLCGSPSEEYWKKSKLPHATIFKPQHPYRRCVAETFKGFPSSALSLLETLLAFESERRGSTTSALQSEFFTSKPLPCDPSMLPKYPPSKEFDAKMREEEARRQRVTGGKGSALESFRKGSKAVAAPDANAELPASIQKWKTQSNQKSNSEKFNPEEDGGSGFRIEPSRGPLLNGHGPRIGNGEFKTQRSINKLQPAAGQLSRFSNSVAARGNSQLDFSRDKSDHSFWKEQNLNTRYDQQNDAECSHHLLNRPDSSSYRSNAYPPKKETGMVYGQKKTRMHYSGPLMPPGGNVDEMIKEHEKQIQIAVRKAQLRKGYADNGRADSLLQPLSNGR